MIGSALDNDQYGLLFAVRRSIRYHDRRRSFFERMHRLTSVLTIILAGGVLFELAGTGSPAKWLQVVGVFAGALAALDMVVGYSARATQHANLRRRFADLEMAMLTDGLDQEVWKRHQLERLAIERDEPPIYRALDLLCHNEMMQAEGFSREKTPEHFAAVSAWQRYTSHFLHWPNLASG